MSFTTITALNDHVRSFLSPIDLIRLESVSKSNTSTPFQWRKLLYNDKNEFKQIAIKLLSYCNEKSTKIVKDFVLTRRINSQQARDILKQDFIGKQWCLTVYGIQLISSGIFSPSEINAIDNIGCNKRQRIIDETCTKMLIGGLIKKEEVLSMTLDQLDQMIKNKKQEEYLRTF